MIFIIPKKLKAGNGVDLETANGTGVEGEVAGEGGGEGEESGGVDGGGVEVEVEGEGDVSGERVGGVGEGVWINGCHCSEAGEFLTFTIRNVSLFAGSFKRRLAGVATAPPCGASSLVSSGRCLKRKIGCIDVSTQTGRKNKIDDDYVFGPNIGKGKFGSVRICRSKSNGIDFACKTLKKGEETVHREVEIMQHLSGHPRVVTLHAVYEESDCFHLVMELCSGGRLIDQMVKEGRYSEQRAANIFKDLMLVINYCHEMGVVHRDIKPENILLTAAGKIQLADFGLAMRIAKGQTLSGLAGSPAYVAPEVLSESYSEKVDVWSAGVLLYALLSGVLPFKGDSLDAIFEAIKKVKLDLNSGVWESVSKPARDLLSTMVTRDESARITADEVLSKPFNLFQLLNLQHGLLIFCLSFFFWNAYH
ncbi:serine/threonine-protein kinase PEPKR2-like [Brassica napus]|uniref:serine/threonine-protein kinase PEPKR2-like n=1 Tax=Brassica napus TaxID=3708 RepID=UPI0020791B96|nr:serine/threonine-protein kinase PEPKR2-like [Brassica napus]